MSSRTAAAARCFVIVSRSVVFLVPFAFILLTAAKDQAEAAQLRVLAADRVRAARTTSPRRSRRATTCWSPPSSTASSSPSRASRSWSCSRDGRPTCCSGARAGGPRVVNVLVLRADHPAGRRADRSGCCRSSSLFKTLHGHDPDRGRLRPVVLHPALPGVHRDHPARARRGRDHRRRRAAAAVLQRHLPAAAPGRS